MLVNEYRQKVIDLLKENNYKHINCQHDFLVQFTECSFFDDIVYYLYCKRMVEANRIVHTEHEFLYLLPVFSSQYNRYVDPAKLELRNYKILKIYDRKDKNI